MCVLRLRRREAEGLLSDAWNIYGADHDAKAGVEDAPMRFSATSLIVWLYRRAGIALADDLLKLHRSGKIIIGSDLEAGDLVFRTGPRNLFHPGDPRGVGHLGVYVGEGRVLHASYWADMVGVNPIDWFLSMNDGKFRGVRRPFARF